MKDLTPAEYEQLKRDAAEARRGRSLPPPLGPNSILPPDLREGITFAFWVIAAVICSCTVIGNAGRLLGVQEQTHVITLTEAVLSIYYFLVFVFWTYLTYLCFKKGYND